MKALIKVGYACNENCTFCHTADMRHIDDSAERVEWKIDRAKRLGYSMVVLSGGEPTMRPELLRWARRVAGHGLDFGLVTNGLMLSYRHVVDELVDACRLRYVYMSMHGGEPKVHGSVVRADTFQRAFEAVKNLHGRIPDLTVNCVITTANLRHLRGLVDRLLPFPELCIKLSMTQPKGAANRAFDVIVPDVAACAAEVRAAIEHGLAKRTSDKGPRFAHDGIPFCLLPGLEHLYDDLKTHRYATMIEADEDDFVPVDDVAKIQPEETCGDCALRGPCPGLYRGYWEAHGASALRPITGKPRANSYNFVPERDILRPPGAPCPIRHDGTSPYDRARTLFLRLKDRMRLFRTETRDFSDEELLAIKEGKGQVYVDISTKLAPDDFSKDLKQLRPQAECEQCPERPRCAGCWEPVPTDVFTRDDRAVIDVLARLRGKILDLGCGEGPYLDAFARSAADHADFAYTGVDPDPGRIAVLASRYPFARFVVARAEEIGDDVGPVDHVLVLRSYNHLADPARALDRAIALLRPGGTLTVVDNVAFGLVRGRAHAARAEAAPENQLEHFRNDDASRALARLEGRPLRLLERRDVARGTSNQWLLRFERIEEQVSP
ncbi:radical SAM protein [Polyangium aurulentum]|uniref:radical SAM protein n=1 Tax=Polyangium aurulentum TaxID=2567896 RepID=UPI0010AE5629|nr:radical SAM protein [Polyangium aurulentum]UQA58012.1 radical SAM protein [Polyangium aurulentum]